MLLLLPLLGDGLRAADSLAPYFRKHVSTNGTLSLEVAARELVPLKKHRPRLWLVGVIHLGETNYYAALQRFLDRQDVVLFEGIGAKDGNFQLQDSDYSLQDRMADALGLVFQLKAIDYTRPNFKNSDLSYAELAALFSSGQDAGSAGQKSHPTPTTEGDAGKQPSGRAEFDALVQIMEGRGLFGGLARLGVSAIAASPRLQATARIMLIELLGSLPANLADSAGMPAGMQQLMEGLIRARNEVVVRDLRREIRRRPRPKSIGVFYGAGHMADLEAKLCTALGYRPGRERWFTALSINPTATGLSRFEVGMARAMSRLQLHTLEGFGNQKAGKETEAKPPPPTAAKTSPGLEK